jgi:hypothetical protein
MGTNPTISLGLVEEETVSSRPRLYLQVLTLACVLVMGCAEKYISPVPEPARSHCSYDSIDPLGPRWYRQRISGGEDGGRIFGVGSSRQVTVKGAWKGAWLAARGELAERVETHIKSMTEIYLSEANGGGASDYQKAILATSEVALKNCIPVRDTMYARCADEHEVFIVVAVDEDLVWSELERHVESLDRASVLAEKIRGIRQAAEAARLRLP